jgi:cyclic beta-1,2-glucan synthetase
VKNPGRVCRGVARVLLDGQEKPGAAEIKLIDDGREHHVEVTLGGAS